MPVIQITSEELGARGQHVRELLRPLSKQSGGPAWKLTKRSSYQYVIGTHDGSPSSSSHQDWRFATFVPSLRANYFELWKRIDEFWYLDRAYLNIFQTDPIACTEKKFLSLHCDPNEPDDAPHVMYKRGPHLHIQAASDPFPHAHIALTGEHLGVVLSSFDSLFKAMEWAVYMLKEQVLDAMV